MDFCVWNFLGKGTVANVAKVLLVFPGRSAFGGMRVAVPVFWGD